MISNTELHVRAAEHWSNTVTTHRARWWDSPRIWKYVNYKICGQYLPGVVDGDAAVIAQTARRPVANGISIGAGNGFKEIDLVQRGIVKRFDLYEISDARVKDGRQRVREAGLEGQIKFFQELVDFDHPPADRYDLVYWNNALHHMMNTRAAIRWSKNALRAGGVFYMNDFVGPTRFQWSDRVLAACSALRAAMPAEFFKSRYGGLDFPIVLERPDPLVLAESDPTEAADSANILTAIDDLLPGADVRPVGGAAYLFAFDDVMANIDEDSPWFQLMFVLDELLEQAGEFNYAVATWVNVGSEPIRFLDRLRRRR